MSVNPEGWYNGAGNKLYLANQKTDSMRYHYHYLIIQESIHQIQNILIIDNHQAI